MSARVVGASAGSAAGGGSGILELPFQLSDATLEGIHLIVVIIWYGRIRHDGGKASNKWRSASSRRYYLLGRFGRIMLTDRLFVPVVVPVFSESDDLASPRTSARTSRDGAIGGSLLCFLDDLTLSTTTGKSFGFGLKGKAHP